MVIGAMPASAQTHSAVEPAARTGRQMQRHQSFNKIVESQKGEVDLIFIGDSITQGWEGNGRGTWEYYYGDRRAVNLGIGGDRTQHVLWRLENGNIDGISPKLAVVMIGTNNSADDRNTAGEIVDGVQAVVGKLRSSLPDTKILLLGIFPRGSEFNNQRGKILQVNQVIRKLSDDSMVAWLDIGHHFIDADGRIPSTIMPDALHLSPLGYELWAQAIEKRLARLLDEDPKPARPSHASGEWTWVMDGPDGQPVEASLNITSKKAAVNGSIAFGEFRSFTLDDGFAAGPYIAFNLTRNRPNGESITYKMAAEIKLDGGKFLMDGSTETNLEGQKMNSPWKASRPK